MSDAAEERDALPEVDVLPEIDALSEIDALPEVDVLPEIDVLAKSGVPRSEVPRAVLLMIDVQRCMLLPPQPVPAAEKVGARLCELLDDARGAGMDVIHVRNNGGAGDPDAPGSDGWNLVHQPTEDEAIIDKTEPDAFAGTDLGELIDPGDRLIIAGMQSEHCVRVTALAALNRGHLVTVVTGAHATYDDGRPAGAISAEVDVELRAAGARVTDDPWSWER